MSTEITEAVAVEMLKAVANILQVGSPPKTSDVRPGETVREFLDRNKLVVSSKVIYILDGQPVTLDSPMSGGNLVMATAHDNGG